MIRTILVAVLVCLLATACATRPPAASRVDARDAATMSTQASSTQATDEAPPSQAPFLVRSLVVELAPGQGVDTLRDAARATLAAEPQIAPLFPQADDDALARIHTVRLAEPVPEPQAWDWARALRDAGGFLRVEPDLEDQQPPGQREAAAACTVDDGVAVPTDPAWSLREIHAPEAWALEPPPGGRRFGEGVRICHPDTGWTEHAETDRTRLDLAAALDLIDRNGQARDTLGYSGNPGHGTATGSVIASAGGVADMNGTTPPGTVTGVAPRATLVPIRAIRSVVRFLDSNVAKAVAHADAAQCDVISMSLGGRMFFGLERAIEAAVEDDTIVVAAAGNCVGFMVAPAIYPATIAAAASNANHAPWNGSSRGRAVTLAAPGEDVYIARRGARSDPLDRVEASDGTSFATAEIAGAAALWIAFHGRERLDAARGAHRLRDLFVYALRESADDRGGSWDTRRFGAGILDVEKLLQVDLGGFPRDAPRSAARPDTPLVLLARSLDLDTAATAQLLQNLFGDESPDVLADRYAAELHRYLVTRPADFARLRAAAEQRMGGDALRVRADGLSNSLRGALQP